MLKISKKTALCLALALLPMQAYAQGSVKDAANRIAACVKARNAEACRENITASSADIFDRFASYDLMDCLPQSATYISSKPDGSAMQVRAAVTTGDKKSNVRLLFQQEEEEWKLDIPGTLREGIGENWESQLNATEQVYQMLKGQMGDKLNCTMIRNLGSGLTAKTSN